MLSCVGVLAWANIQMRGHTGHQVRTLPCVLLLCVGTLTHLVAVSTVLPVDWARGLGSLPMLGIFFLAAIALEQLLLASNERQIRAGARACLYAIGLITLLGILGWLQPDRTTWIKSLFPFSEPSHLALFTAPILVFNCVTTKPTARLLMLCATLAAAVFLENVTLVALSLMTACLCLNVRHLLLLLLPAIPIALSLNLEYYLVRLDFSGESESLSNLVFFQGWQLMFESWEKSGGLGLGFQQLGVFGSETAASELIFLIMDDYMNLLDGGFNLAKFVSEFGIFGIVVVAGFLYKLGAAVKVLRSVAIRGKQAPAVLLFAGSSMFAYTVELFLRGVGYFSPSGLILAASVLIWLRYERRAFIAPQRKLASAHIANNGRQHIARG